MNFHPRLLDAASSRSNTFNVWAAVLLLTAGLAWLACMAFAYALGQRQVAEGLFNPLVLTPGLIVLLFWANAHGRTLARGAQVLGTLRAPHALWRQWLWASTRDITAVWLAFTMALGLFCVGQDGGWSRWLNMAATISVCVSLLTVLTLHTDKVAGGRARDLWFVLMGLLVGFPALTRLAQSATQLPFDLPPPVVALGVLAWPATAWWLWRTWQDHMLRRSDAPGARQGALTWGEWLEQGMRRYVALHLYVGKHGAGDYARLERRGVAGYLGAGVIFAAVFDLVGRAPLLQWGEPVSLGSLPIVFLWALVPANLLVCRDLHWRTLLLPKQGKSWGLGTRVFGSTLLQTSACATLLQLLDAMRLQWFSSNEVALGTVAMLNWLVTESKLAAMVALATLVLSLKHPVRVLVGLVVLAAAAKLALVTQYGWLGGPQLLTVDAVFVAGLWVLAAIVLWVANRLLTPQRLLRAAAPY